MIVFVTFFLIALLVSTITIWLYRSLSNWNGFSQIAVDKTETKRKGRGNAQQSFSFITLFTRGNAKSITLPYSERGIKAPWGW